MNTKQYSSKDFLSFQREINITEVLLTMKLWAMPCGATQDRQVMAKSSGKTWSTWRREWQTTSIFLLWEPHEQYEKAKSMTLKDEILRSVGAQYAAGDQWGNNTRKNEEEEPKQKQHPGADVTGNGSKVQYYKEQYCIETWNSGPWIKVNWKWSNKRL